MLKKSRLKVIAKFLIIILVFTSCSSSSDDDCTYKIFNSYSLCEDEGCRYALSIGLNNCNRIVTEVDEVTFNNNKLEIREEKCWEGEAPDFDIYPYNNEDRDCQYKIFSFSFSTVNDECEYGIGYGTDPFNYKVIPTNEATFDYYLEQDEIIGEICWEGEK